MKATFIKIATLLLCAALLVGAVGCTAVQTEEQGTTDTTATAGTTAAEDTTAAKQKLDVHIATLMGPTGMGMAQLMSDTDRGIVADNYTFTVASAPDEVTAGLIKGEFDIAAIPTNLAAVLYQKTSGQILCAAVNTLGVLYLVENGDTVKSVSDLAGKTIYATGQASTPEYILRYILKENGIDPDTDVTIEYLTEHSALATQLASGSVVLGMLPEPNVTAAMSQNADLRIALNLTEEWEKLGNDTTIMQGCIVVNKTFAQEHPQAVADFLAGCRDSVSYTFSHPVEAATMIEKYGILAKAALAEKALPNCNITYLDGDEMKTGLTAFLQVLFDANPASVGGTMPDDAFFYQPQA